MPPISMVHCHSPEKKIIVVGAFLTAQISVKTPQAKGAVLKHTHAAQTNITINARSLTRWKRPPQCDPFVGDFRWAGIPLGLMWENCKTEGYDRWIIEGQAWKSTRVKKELSSYSRSTTDSEVNHTASYSWHTHDKSSSGSCRAIFLYSGVEFYSSRL